VIGIDTNVLARALLQDDEIQSRIADRFLPSLSRSDPGLITHAVLLELWWVLGIKGVPVSVRRVLFVDLLETAELLVQDSDVVRRALSSVADGADFPDALIAETGRALQCSTTVTFDVRTSRRARMELLVESK